MKAIRTSKATTKDTTTFDKLCAQAIKLRQRQREIEEENHEVIAELAEVKTTLEGINERIKIEARKMSILGQTKVLVDNQDIHVSVIGKPEREWDLEKARASWPREAVKLAVKEYIDPKVVEALKETGVLDEDKIGLVVTVRPATPAVTIRLP